MPENRTVENALAFADASGRTIVRVALGLTVYFGNAHEAPVRRAVADCMHDFVQLVGARITWVKHPVSYEWREANAERISAFEPWLLGLIPQKAWEFHLHGGVDREEASDIQFTALGLASWDPQGHSHLKIVLPLTWFADHPGSLADLALGICRRLKPVSGYGAVCFVDAPDYGNHSETDPLIYTLAQRFMGIDVDSPVSHSLYLKDTIKGVNWLTILSDPLMDRIGGRESLRSQLMPPASMLDYDGGAIVKSGPRPQFGDREAGQSCLEYAAVNKLLKPLRIASMGLQISGRGPRFDRAVSDAWLARFD